MTNNNYSIQEDKDTLILTYKNKTNIKLISLIWVVVLLSIFAAFIFGIAYSVGLASIIIWDASPKNILIPSILLVIGAIVAYCFFNKEVTYTFIKKLLLIWNELLLFFQRQFFTSYYCLVRKNAISQHNTNTKIQDKKSFSLAINQIKSINIYTPESYERFYQIQFLTEVGNYRLELFFKESELDELTNIIKKIKAYLH
ncbi:MAG: hypothetical protein MK212_04275 [Saprospiraceae bacterium]|nr:hypothetical protein [Saprospiraceae bacterium]